MTVGVGVDWASGHWVSARCGDDDPEVGAFPSILNVWHEYRGCADRILVDIPIGLPACENPADLDDGRRRCDRAASRKLGSPLTSSVFTTPCREAVYADSYEEAREVNRRTLGRGLGSHSWSLVPRIREVDVFLRGGYAGDGCPTRESHPEVCFVALADLADEDIAVLHRKSEDPGIDERKDILGAHSPSLVDRYEAIGERLDGDGTYDGWKRRITSSRLDDVLDAMALAVTASRDEEQLGSLPPDPPTDEKGLPMEIVYPAKQ